VTGHPGARLAAIANAADGEANDPVSVLAWW